MNPRKIQFRFQPTPEEIARAAASEWIRLLEERSGPTIPFGVALSGGRLAAAFFHAAASGARESGANLFNNVHCFWADERCVPPNDPESNFYVARRELFEPLRIPEAQIHRIRGEIEPAAAALEAEREARAILATDTAGRPVFDLILLGMGEDGHVASLFPGESRDLLHDRRVYREILAAPKPPPKRVTLGYEPLLAAKRVWVLASGEAKRPAVQRLIAGDPALPITRIVSARDETLFFHDLPGLSEP